MDLVARPRIVRALVGTALAALIGLLAAPAAADPAGPTNYRSEVTTVAPDIDGVEVSVVGGDGFLLVEVSRGHRVEVPGYSGEPYLRFGADGRVEENQSSPARALNQSRDGTDAGPPLDADAKPRWVDVATDGRWAWHDHRIHNMASTVPAAAHTPAGNKWAVPLTVDGTDVTVSGRYRLRDAPSPVPWMILGAAAAVIVVVVGRAVAPITAAGSALVLAGAGALVTGVFERGASPPGAPTSPLIVVLPAIAVVAGMIVVVQRGRVLRAVLAMLGAATAGGWALVRAGVFVNAELPTSLPATTDRFLTAVALGAALGVAVVVARSGALAPPGLDDPGDAGHAGHAGHDDAARPAQG